MKKVIKKEKTKVKALSLNSRVEQLELIIKVMAAFISFIFVLSVLK